MCTDKRSFHTKMEVVENIHKKLYNEQFHDLHVSKKIFVVTGLMRVR